MKNIIMKPKNERTVLMSLFHPVELIFEKSDAKNHRTQMLQLFLLICTCLLIYGAVMGSYHSVLQALASGVKLIILFAGAVLISFPSFFVIQQVLGSKLSFIQMMQIILSGFALTSVIAVSFSPIIIFFQITGGNYHFLQLLHVAVFLFAGVFGLRVMVEALKYACDKKDIYPQLGVNVFRIWVIILTFVGIQLAWNLRPFVCNKNEAFRLFRDYEGNFYTAIIYSVKQLNNSEKNMSSEYNKSVYYTIDTAAILADTAHIKKLLED